MRFTIAHKRHKVFKIFGNWQIRGTRGRTLDDAKHEKRNAHYKIRNANEQHGIFGSSLAFGKLWSAKQSIGLYPSLDSPFPYNKQKAFYENDWTVFSYPNQSANGILWRVGRGFVIGLLLTTIIARHLIGQHELSRSRIGAEEIYWAGDAKLPERPLCRAICRSAVAPWHLNLKA